MTHQEKVEKGEKVSKTEECEMVLRNFGTAPDSNSPPQREEGKCPECDSKDGWHMAECSKSLCPTPHLEEWDRKKVEEELKEEIRTILRMINSFEAKGDAEIMGVALPNLLLYVFNLRQEALQHQREGIRREIEDIDVGKLEGEDVEFNAGQKLLKAKILSLPTLNEEVKK